jgi:hypothetical protein
MLDDGRKMLSSLWERGELECLPMGSQFIDGHFKVGMALHKKVCPHTRFFSYPSYITMICCESSQQENLIGHG